MKVKSFIPFYPELLPNNIYFYRKKRDLTQITDTEVRQKGMNALIAALGEVDAARFITLLNREPFDYTQWQKRIFPDWDVLVISKLAMNSRNDIVGR